MQTTMEVFYASGSRTSTLVHHTCPQDAFGHAQRVIREFEQLGSKTTARILEDEGTEFTVTYKGREQVRVKVYRTPPTGVDLDTRERVTTCSPEDWDRMDALDTRGPWDGFGRPVEAE